MRLLAFLPGYVVPPLVALAFVYVFTRLLTPADYGLYAVVASLAQLTAAAVFSWLHLSVRRFYAEALEGGWLGKLLLTIAGSFAVAAVAVVIVYVVALGFFHAAPANGAAYALGAGLAIARTAGAIAKAFRVGGLEGWRYSLMEGAESLTTFVVALAFVKLMGWGAVGMIAGAAIGALAPVVLDFRALLRRFRGAAWDPVLARRLLRFGLPFTAAYALEYVLSSSDRLLIQHFLGDGAVGTYAVAYTLADRAVSAPFQAISLVTYPLLMAAHAKGGDSGARLQARTNFEMLWAVGLPALAGFVIASPLIAAVMVGGDFAPEAQAIMPWIAVGVFLSGLRLHYIDHAFHVAKRTDVTLVSVSVPAVVNFVLNVVLLPRIGVLGAVISTVAAYALAIVVDGILAARMFPMPVPLRPAAKIVAATAVMVIAVRLAAFPATTAGLVGLIATGAVVYAAAAIVLDIAGTRAILMRHFRRRPPPQSTT